MITTCYMACGFCPWRVEIKLLVPKCLFDFEITFQRLRFLTTFYGVLLHTFNLVKVG